jgi:hypothetical protein
MWLASLLIVTVPVVGCGEETGSKASDSAARSLTGDRSPSPSADVQTYGADVFDSLLAANVANGLVDYDSFRGSKAFDRFLLKIAEVDTATLTTDAELAFWINAYNALVIKNVLDHPGITNPLDVDGFFDKTKFPVAGTHLTLNQIENDVVRPKFSEQLIHFGLVCAALSCPPLIPKAYTAENVRSQLAENARNYLGDSDQNRFEAGTATLYLSRIFEWYKADFGDSDSGLREFAMKYGPTDMKSGLASHSDAPVKFLEYDWKLNSRQLN